MAMQLRASSSFSSASFTRDVFLSFRGEDTRYGFTGHLYKYLLQRGISIFIDDDLRKGDEISAALLQAIEDSKLSIIVFSENYASSKWCLNELVHILDCRRSKKQMVHPIFYKVDPSDVRHQKGKFGESLADLERRFKDDMSKVLGWRAALSEAANLSGWHFSGGYEYEFIDKIVEQISDKFAQVYEPTYLHMPKCQVGLDSRVKYMLEMLDVGGSDIRIAGIWGIGGIGKTTIAKAVYNAIARKFDGCCFLANVREGSEQHGGLVNLQNILLSSINVRQKELKIHNVHEGITLLSKSLRHKKILLVIDDVDSLDQLEKLAGSTDWFRCGSRVIITTRDKRLLTDHGVEPTYNVHGLGYQEALVLFSSKALLDIENLGAAEELLVTEVVKYAQGIPLALELLGSYLRGTSVQKWQAMLDGFKKDPPKSIQDILLISYAGLQNTVRHVFLDIACFFKAWKRNDVIQILEGCDRINPEHSIKLLEQKALIYIDRDDKIRMHDLLEEMGKGQVLQESTEPGERSRLWQHMDVHYILTKNTGEAFAKNSRVLSNYPLDSTSIFATNEGTSKIKGMMVKMPTADEIRLSPKCFKKMKNLKIFINVNGRFVGKVDHYPNQLRLLDWPQCPLQFLPSNFDANKLVQLNMCQGRISRLGEGFKRMQNLKSLILRECKFLAKIPDMSGSPNLEVLDLYWCKSLVEVHPSVGYLEKLVQLDISQCSNLALFPEKANWESLEQLDLEGCSKLESFPEIVGEMRYMTSLRLDNTAIKTLPSSIRYLINLEGLYITNCGNLKDLPCSIYDLQKLSDILLLECPKLVTFPNKMDTEVLPTYSRGPLDDPESLSKTRRGIPWRYFSATRCNLCNADFLASLLGRASILYDLNLSGSTIVILPEWIKKFVTLRKLDLSNCMRLVEIPELPPRIERLRVRGCGSLERISMLSNILERKESQMIKEMDLTDCWRLNENLIEMANKEDDDEVDADVFCRILSSQNFGFSITFPVPRIEIPRWFSCQMDFKRHRGFEFWIETLPNFKWNNTGLAFCVAVDRPKSQEPFTFCRCQVFIEINEESVAHFLTQRVYSEEWDVVLVHYVPFHEMWNNGCMFPLPPFTVRVVILQYSLPFLVSVCGVHLVMPPKEDICMKLIRAENLTSEFSEEEFYKASRDKRHRGAL